MGHQMIRFIVAMILAEIAVVAQDRIPFDRDNYYCNICGVWNGTNNTIGTPTGVVRFTHPTTGQSRANSCQEWQARAGTNANVLPGDFCLNEMPAIAAAPCNCFRSNGELVTDIGPTMAPTREDQRDPNSPSSPNGGPANNPAASPNNMPSPSNGGSGDPTNGDPTGSGSRTMVVSSLLGLVGVVAVLVGL